MVFIAFMLAAAAVVLTACAVPLLETLRDLFFCIGYALAFGFQLPGGAGDSLFRLVLLVSAVVCALFTICKVLHL